MIKISDLKVGDYVVADYEGQLREGQVTELNKEDKEICVETDVQAFWFKPEQLFPIPLDEKQLLRLNFEKETNGEGQTKYKRGPFRVQVSDANGFNDFDIWYREDRRHIKQPIFVHELQNHYRDMTKVELV